MKNLFYVMVMALVFSVFAGQQSSVFSQEKKEWTMLIFLNGDNNLDSAAVDDIREMEKVGSPSWMNVVVQFDYSDSSVGVRRMLIKKNPSPYSDERVSPLSLLKSPFGSFVKADSQFYSPVIEQLPELDMGDWRVFRDFVTWGMEKFPAEHYFVSIWNHGAGWKKRAVPTLRGVSYDDTDGGHITTPQLREALDDVYNKNQTKIDIFGFDACFMQMIEVVTEIQNRAGIVIGSEETEPGDGWPYDDFLNAVTKARAEKKAALSGEEIVIPLVKTFQASYDGGSQGYGDTTLSAIRTEKLPPLLDSINNVVRSIVDDGSIKTTALSKLLKKVQKYYFPEYKDLYHFSQLIVESGQVDENRKFIEENKQLMKAIDDLVIMNSYTGSSMENSHGISIHLPTPSSGSSVEWDKYSSKRDAYLKLEFANVSLWDEFLDFMYIKSRNK